MHFATSNCLCTHDNQVEVAPLESISQASSLLSGSHFDVIILCDVGLDSLKAWNALSRRQGVKMISSTVVGVTGMIFTDLLDRFVVEDIEGESHKEVNIMFLVLQRCTD